MTSIDLVTLVKYLRKSDMECGKFPESMWEGYATGVNLFEDMLNDNLISEEEFEELMTYLEDWWPAGYWEKWPEVEGL